MKFTFRWPSVGLEVGTLFSDEFRDTILTKIGVREMARRCSLSPTTVSLFAAGKIKLPWPTVMSMAAECGLEENLWTATIYDRVDAAEKLGWDFHPQDSVKRKEQE